MIVEMKNGLGRHGGGKMRMLLTYVDNLPDGNESGVFYALDLGGTNFRVLRVQLGGKQGGVVRKESREAAIPHALMQGTKDFQGGLRQPGGSALDVEMENGLGRDGGGKMRMLLTYVDNLPYGNESGVFYALDLGGANFRVLRVQFGGKQGGVVRKESREAAIPHALMQGTNKDLFDYIAKELKEFASTGDESFAPESTGLELGFTFSFPMHQTSINSGNLINWTKGFTVPDTVGKDVVKELEAAAISRQGLKMRVSALVNDTVGTLARGHFVDEDVMISVRTGTNGCKSDSKVAKWPWHRFHGDQLLVRQSSPSGCGRGSGRREHISR